MTDPRQISLHGKEQREHSAKALLFVFRWRDNHRLTSRNVSLQHKKSFLFMMESEVKISSFLLSAGSPGQPYTAWENTQQRWRRENTLQLSDSEDIPTESVSISQHPPIHVTPQRVFLYPSILQSMWLHRECFYIPASSNQCDSTESGNQEVNETNKAAVIVTDGQLVSHFTNVRSYFSSRRHAGIAHTRAEPSEKSFSEENDEQKPWSENSGPLTSLQLFSKKQHTYENLNVNNIYIHTYILVLSNICALCMFIMYIYIYKYTRIQYIFWKYLHWYYI